MLRAEEVSFRYGEGRYLFEKVDFSLAAGEVVGLPGPSGRGKTTLGRLLCGYLQAEEGRVILDGKPLPKIGYCPAQLLFQHPELAMNPRHPIGVIVDEAFPCSEETRQLLGIRPSWLSRYPHELSGGELQRIALARIMTSATRYLVADEMTAMLDANTQAYVWKVMLQWARANGIGILAICHDMHLLRRIADRIDDRFTV
jgi:peptide/nickel transport system ATP-binding protein